MRDKMGELLDWATLALVLVALVVVVCCCQGCVQVDVAVHDSRGAGRMHQDVARVTSSEQTATASADVPVSLVPK